MVKKECITELKAHAISRIKSFAQDGKLICHPDLPYILFQWRSFAENDSTEIKAWTSEQLKNDESVSIFARAFTGTSWSQGMGMSGLGDRVAMRNVEASVSGLEHVIDVHEFRRRLEEIEKSEILNKEKKGSVLVFLEAWRKKEAGYRR